LDGSMTQLLQILIIGVPILLAITFHEAAHGFVALRYGDDTALKLGRVTLNPLKHIDPIGTILIPGLLLLSGSGFLFGYAKPVPVNFARLNSPRKDMILVAAAGPGTNLLLALISALLLKIMFVAFIPSPFDQVEPSFLAQIIVKSLNYSIFINVLLALFNMLPIPPLDGGRVFVGLLPPRLAAPLANVEPYGIFLLLAIIFLLPVLSQAMGYPINVFTQFLLPIVNSVINFIMILFGF